MDTVESTEQGTSAAQAGARAGPGWLRTSLIAGLALMIGLGAGWLAFAPEPPNDTDRQIQSLVDDYVAAWDAHDGQAVVALMTKDGVHYSGGAAGGKDASGDSLARSLAFFVEHHAAGISFASVNDAVIRTQDGPPYLVANVVELGMSTSGSETEQAVAVYRIVPEDGVLKIQVETFLIEGLD